MRENTKAKKALKPTALSELKLAEAKALLAQAKKPVLYVGGGVGMAKATQAVKKFLQITKMPSVSTLKGLGSIDPTDPVYMGMIGMHGTRAANVAVQECDLLLVCGARFDDRVTCLLYTSDAADEEDSVDLGGRRIINKKKKNNTDKKTKQNKNKKIQ